MNIAKAGQMNIEQNCDAQTKTSRWLAAGLLAGLTMAVSACQGARDGRVHTLSELMIDDGNTLRPYTEVVGKLPGTGLFSPSLPDGDLPVTALTADTSWMADYDFDNDGVLSAKEQTQGWLVFLATEKSGDSLAPQSLKSFPRTAAATSAVPAPQSLSGVSLAGGDSKGIRAAIDGLAGPASAAMAETETVIAAVAADAGDSAGDGADGGGAGADGADGGAGADGADGGDAGPGAAGIE